MRGLILITAILLTACATTQKSKSVLPQGEWRLTVLNDSNVSALPKAITLQLDSAETRASGFASCNQYFGSYSIDGLKIKFSNIGSTKMFCESTQQTENDFLKALEQVSSFQCDGETLNLYYKGESLRLSFVKIN